MQVTDIYTDTQDSCWPLFAICHCKPILRSYERSLSWGISVRKPSCLDDKVQIATNYIIHPQDMNPILSQTPGAVWQNSARWILYTGYRSCCSLAGTCSCLRIVIIVSHYPYFRITSLYCILKFFRRMCFRGFFSPKNIAVRQKQLVPGMKMWQTSTLGVVDPNKKRIFLSTKGKLAHKDCSWVWCYVNNTFILKKKIIIKLGFPLKVCTMCFSKDNSWIMFYWWQ